MKSSSKTGQHILLEVTYIPVTNGQKPSLNLASKPRFWRSGFGVF